MNIPRKKNIPVSCSSFRPDGQYILDHELGSVMGTTPGKTTKHAAVYLEMSNPRRRRMMIYIYIYMYKLTYINDVCIYLTLFIY